MENFPKCPTIPHFLRILSSSNIGQSLDVQLTILDSDMPFLAVLPNGREIRRTYVGDGFHGTSKFAPDSVLANGIPPKGADRRLYEHALGNEASAFRGTTELPVISSSGQGAAYWADVGGWVYEVESVSMWALEKELQGQVPRPDGFGNCPNVGELEQATPARIDATQIVRAFVVEAGRVRNGKQTLLVKAWKPSPRP